MINKKEIEKLKTMVGEGRTLDVLHNLKDKVIGSDFHDEIILLLNSINIIHKKRRVNLITLEEEMLAENRLAYAILDILKNIELQNNYKNTNKKIPKTSNPVKSDASDNTKIKNTLSPKELLLTLDGKKTINILILGETGVGKSTFINSIFGKAVSEVSSFMITTLSIDIYNLQLTTNLNIVNFQFIDCPGLDIRDYDIDKIGNSNEMMLDIIKSKIKEVDILLYLKPMNIRLNLREHERQAIKLISAKLGKDIWSKTIFVLSKSDQILDNGGIFEFCSKFNYVTNSIRQEVVKHTDCINVLNLSFLPTYIEKNLANEIDWTSRFWNEVETILNKRSSK